MTNESAATSAPDGSRLLEVLTDSYAATELARTTAQLTEALVGTTDGGVLLSGLHGSSSSLLLAAWFAGAHRTALAIAPDRESALRLADDLETWLGPDDVVYLPQQEVLAFDRNSPDPPLVGDFLAGLDRLASGRATLAVTSLVLLSCVLFIVLKVHMLFTNNQFLRRETFSMPVSYVFLKVCKNKYFT